MNHLNIDPENLKMDFGKDWSLFLDSRVHKFLKARLSHELHQVRLKLENADPDEVRHHQGWAKHIRNFMTLLDQVDVSEPLKETVKHLETYGR